MEHNCPNYENLCSKNSAVDSPYILEEQNSEDKDDIEPNGQRGAWVKCKIRPAQKKYVQTDKQKKIKSFAPSEYYR